MLTYSCFIICISYIIHRYLIYNLEFVLVVALLYVYYSLCIKYFFIQKEGLFNIKTKFKKYIFYLNVFLLTLIVSMICSFSFFINNQQILINFASFLGITPMSAPQYEQEVSTVSTLNNSDIDGYNYNENVPKGDVVGGSFFKNTLFVGDSLTLGIKDIGIFPSNNVLAYGGIDPETAMTLKIFENGNGDSVTLFDSMIEYDANQIYIMLGANGVGYMSPNSLLNSYENLVEGIMDQHPKSKIFIQSILPVTSQFEQSNSYHSNKKIDQMNELLKQMCYDKQLYYINVAETFMDDDGAMKKELSTDGLHISPKGYDIWAEYLKCHTVS